MLGKLFLLFSLTTVVELFLLIKLGAWMGLLWTLLLIIATGAAGAWLARREGLRSLDRIRRQVQDGQMPTDALLDGLCVLIAGAFLLTPGVLTDIAGFLLLVPAARVPLKEALMRRIARSMREGMTTAQVTFAKVGPKGFSTFATSDPGARPSSSVADDSPRGKLRVVRPEAVYRDGDVIDISKG